MATSQIDKTSDEIINIKCCLCLEDNRISEADKYCVQCKNYYCTPCTGMHKKFPTMKDHKLLDKADFRSLGPDGSLPSLPTQRCSEHPTEVINLYCKRHDEVACALCIALTHRTCSNIQSIPEVVGKLFKTKHTLTSTKQKILKVSTAMQEIKTAKQQKIKDLKTYFDKEVQSIKSFRQELQSQLDKMEQETIRELKKEFDRIESCLTREIIEVNKLIDAMNEAALQLKKSEGNIAQEYVSIKTSEKVTAKAENVEKEQRKTQETVSFTADQNIKTFLQQLQALGKVSSLKPSVTKQKNSLYKVKQKREIDVKLVNDTFNCNIWGSCMTDRCILLADRYNKKLKRLDMSTETVKDYLDLPDEPIAVCMISSSEAAVTLRMIKTVQFVSMGNKLMTTRTLTLNHDCWGLAHLANKLFISDSMKTVYIDDMNGKLLQTISTDASGKDIFQETRHITVSAAGDRVFVADYNKGLVILDHQGKYLTTLTDPTVSDTVGVCTDGNNLFVCGWMSNNIVQIGQDYKLLGVIGKVNRPTSLCFDPHKTRLVVTSSDNNNITVLELE